MSPEGDRRPDPPRPADPQRQSDAARRSDPPRRPPSLSTPTQQRWSPFGTGVAVFTAIAIPIVVVGYIRDGALSATYTVIGIGLGLIAGLIAGLWVDSRGGEVWRGPRL